MKDSRKSRAASQTACKLSPVRARKERENAMMVTLYLQGNSLREVVRIIEEKTNHRFGMSTVANAVKKATQEWQKSKDDTINAHKAIELEKINRVEAAAWEGWERSMQLIKTKSTTRQKDKDTGGMKVVRMNQDEEQGVGDSRFLAIIQTCVDQRCKLLGIDVPQLPLPGGTVNNNTQINNTTIYRKVVFKTKEMTTPAQVVQHVAG